MKHYMRRRAALKVFAELAAAVAVIAGGYVVLNRLEFVSREVVEPAKEVVSSAGLSAEEDPDTLIVDGAVWRKKESLVTCLILGVDKQGEIIVTDDYWTAGQADFQLLLVIDEEAQSYRLLHINRDTMCDIHVLDKMGSDMGLARNQICLAYALGNGGLTSGQNAMTAVSDLLGGQKIDNYLAMNVDGLALLNDSVGGVTVTIEDDFSDADPTLVQGETITLNGRQAETFVRSRRNMAGGLNTDRMRRQRAYLSGLLERLDERQRQDANAVAKLYSALSGYLSGDVTLDQIDHMPEVIAGYRYDGVLTLEGTVDASGTYVEFTPDPEGLESIVLELFYTKEA